MDLEKVYDRVTIERLWFCFKESRVTEKFDSFSINFPPGLIKLSLSIYLSIQTGA